MREKFLYASGGNEHTVYLPEEIDLTSRDTLSSGFNPTTPTSSTKPGQSYYSDQEADSLVGLESSKTYPGTEAVNTGVKQEPKTIIKANKENDEPQAAAYLKLIETLEETLKELTGKGTTVKDQEQWNNVALVLAAQLKVIASRTTISNAPAILAKHLQQITNFKQLQHEKKNLTTPAASPCLN